MQRTLARAYSAPLRASSIRSTPAASLLSNIPYMKALSRDSAQDRTHVSNVERHLRGAGILKLSLDFDVNDSNYLTGLIHGLHKWHGHGLPIAHSTHRGWYWDIRPSQTAFQCPNHQARSETMNEFPWHTDCSYDASPPCFFALQVLRPDKCGGGTLSVLKVDSLLKQLSQSTRAALTKKNYLITVPPEFRKTHSKHESIVGSLLAPDRESGQLVLRFREDILNPLTREAGIALEELKYVLLGPQAQSEVVHLTAEMMPRGSIIIMDNRRWLHRRNEVKDSRRHLKRVRWDAKPFGLD
ncbi:taurine catabolism dioxygenase TauD [Aspergillus terreus]|uniref:Taurine catabolism dioxygenase TauD n=1 Tax=Aspergillus terreus TaxID=33178 RepID=A0A5M3Z3N7_ASPTE|nr:hypothetical protein ATETN484_0009002400 [Aspergillus terreus]GFF17475.1 taurine catabolism dioxygenase TauD [Aspergillus terreus]